VRAGAVGGVGEVEPVEELVGAALGVACGEVEELAEHAQVLAAREELVHGGVLAGQADRAPDGRRFTDDVEPEDACLPLVRREEGGEHAHERGLAGAVRTEEAEDLTACDLEVDPGERLGAAEALAYALDGDRWHGYLSCGVVARGRAVRAGR
jgi:hypothetical protein